MNSLKKEVASFLDDFEPDDEAFTVELKPEEIADPLIREQEELLVKFHEQSPNAAKASMKCERSVNEASLNREPSVSEASTKREQANQENGQSNVNREPSVNQPFSNVNEVSTNREQSVNEASTKFDHNSLTGFQIKIGLYLVNNCLLDLLKSTGRISTPSMVETLESSYGSLRSSILQMKKKGCFKSVTAKKHYREFMLSEGFFYYLETLKKTAHVNETSIKCEPSVNQPLAHPSMSVPSSNSNILNTITTGNDDWMQEIQTPENLKSLGIGGNHIKQLKDKFNIPVEKIQEGLEAFAYDIGKGELERLKARGIHNVISYFFGAMKNGGYNPVNEGFRPSEQQGLDDALARAELKIKEIKEKKQRLENLHFEIWQSETTKEEIEKLVPVGSFKYMSALHQPLVKKYFLENEFSEIQKELPQ